MTSWDTDVVIATRMDASCKLCINSSSHWCRSPEACDNSCSVASHVSASLPSPYYSICSFRAPSFLESLLTLHHSVKCVTEFDLLWTCEHEHNVPKISMNAFRLWVFLAKSERPSTNMHVWRHNTWWTHDEFDIEWVVGAFLGKRSRWWVWHKEC